MQEPTELAEQFEVFKSLDLDPILPIAPTPDNPPWGGWMAFGVWGLSVILIFVVPLLFVLPYIFVKGVDTNDRDALQNFLFTDQLAIALQLAPIILAHAVTFLVCWWVVTRYHTYSFREMLGWEMNGYKWWYSILITIFFFFLAIGLTYIFGDAESSFEQLLKNSRVAVYLTAFFAVFTAPVVEEVVYRGVLYSAFQRRLGKAISVLIVAALFTSVHVPQYSLEATPDLVAIITLFLLSLFLTLVRSQTGNLLPCIVLHTVFNAIQSVIIILRPYVEMFLHWYTEKSTDDSVMALFTLLR